MAKLYALEWKKGDKKKTERNCEKYSEKEFKYLKTPRG